jgi:IS1 family transposase
MAFAKEYRMIVCFQMASTEASLAAPLIAETERRIAVGSLPVWVSDGLDAYARALMERHCILESYPRTGRRGRPRRPKLVACPQLRYGQVVKERDERHRITGVWKRSVYGDVPLERITTAYVERQNLNLRHENRRLVRKTIAFSKKVHGLRHQMVVYLGYFNFVRPHRGLRVPVGAQDGCLRKWQRRTPALAAGITDHIWSLRELMSQKIFIN